MPFSLSRFNIALLSLFMAIWFGLASVVPFIQGQSFSFFDTFVRLGDDRYWSLGLSAVEFFLGSVLFFLLALAGRLDIMDRLVPSPEAIKRMETEGTIFLLLIGIGGALLVWLIPFVFPSAGLSIPTLLFQVLTVVASFVAAGLVKRMGGKSPPVAFSGKAP
ncbi:MAG: hypothetical protein HY917_03715 [Candidatus Diapherotrites archaeon]|nr:hypothetical protein [Candidatus Diapherotrites archaeon]